MKQFKKIMYFLGAVVLIAGITFLFFTYRKYEIRKQLQSAKIKYETGDTAGAVVIFGEVYKKSPFSKEGKEALFFLGKGCIDIGEYEKAEQCWNTLMNLDSRDYGAECLFNLAFIAKEKKRIDIAVDNYERIKREFPASDLVDDAMLCLAVMYKENGKYAEAKNELNSILENYSQSNILGEVERETGKVNIAILFSPAITEDSGEYIVQQGDTLVSIAQKHGMTLDLLKRCNNLKTDFIKPGNRLKIITEKFSIITDKSRNILTLKANEKVIKIYLVGTGIKGSTPAGDYVITTKLVNPPWHKEGEGVIPFGDPKNVLGTRWMGLNIPGYGIHGTWEPETIGKQASAGCIRLLNEDIEELYTIVPSGTEVMIIE